LRDYELMVVISPQVGEDGFPGALARVSQSIAAHGGLVQTTLTNPPWGHRRLAYPIEDYRDAYYAVYHLQFDPGRLDAFERDLKLNDQIIRYLIVRRDDLIRAEAKAAARRTAVMPEAEEGSDGGSRPE
jgi:small subunit ribosomal protein S6